MNVIKMKALLFLSLSLSLTNSFASTYLCSFADEKMGVLQIDIDHTSAKLCHFQKNNNEKWTQIESGHGKLTSKYFDNSRYESMLGFEIITLKRDIRFSLPQNFVDGTKISVTLSMPSKFGPLINSGYASGTSAICFEKKNANPCAADLFKQPKNTPKNFEKLKHILDTNERDWWGDRPTFTLVSKDLEEFEVFNLITDNMIEASSFVIISSNKYEIIQKRILQYLKSGWTLVPVYSNTNGIEFFKTIKH